MLNPTYSCSNCGYKSLSTQGLIKGKSGCTSCGKSNFKCPRCGIYMKMRKGLISKPFPGAVENTGPEKSVKPKSGGDELQARARITKAQDERISTYRKTGEVINPVTGRAYQLGREKQIRRIK